MAFHGTFEHTLDSKNRLTLPAKFRSALAGKVLLVRGSDPCISIFPGEIYDALAAESLQGLSPLSSEAREKRRRFYALVDDVELDGAGRVTLQTKHLQHANLEGSVVVTGTGEALELWEPEAWSVKEAELMASED